MLIDICIKFREYNLSGFQVIERTRFVTDRRADARGKTMSPDPEGGRYNYHISQTTIFERETLETNKKLPYFLEQKQVKNHQTFSEQKSINFEKIILQIYRIKMYTKYIKEKPPKLV